MAFRARRRWVLMISDIRLSPLYFPDVPLTMTAVLRHVPALLWLGLLQPLCHVIATSVAANPAF